MNNYSTSMNKYSTTTNNYSTTTNDFANGENPEEVAEMKAKRQWSIP